MDNVTLLHTIRYSNGQPTVASLYVKRTPKLYKPITDDDKVWKLMFPNASFLRVDGTSKARYSTDKRALLEQEMTKLSARVDSLKETYQKERAKLNMIRSVYASLPLGLLGLRITDGEESDG